MHRLRFDGVTTADVVVDRRSAESLRMELPLVRRYSEIMTDVTRILTQIEQGDPSAAGQLLPLVYDELRKLAAARLVQEKPGQTLQATALVHEAYVRLVDTNKAQHWDSCAHFFAAAAEAMRRILVENARKKQAGKRGGNRQRLELEDVQPVVVPPNADVLALGEAIEKLQVIDPRKADLVKLRYFAGFTVPQAASALGISASTADNDWAYARAWLRVELSGQAGD